MAGERIIRARAVISAKDDTGQAFNSVAEKADRISKKLEAIGRATGISDQIDKTNAALAKQEAALRAIDRYRDARSRIDPLRGELAMRQEKIREIARAMEAMSTPTRKMIAEQNRAIEAARRADRAFKQQSAELAGARKGLADAGLKTGELAEAQTRLRRGVAESNTELQRQNRLLRESAAAEEQAARRSHVMERYGVRHALASGAAAYAGGHSVLHGVVETALAGAHYQDARVGLLNTGLSTDELAQAEEAAKRAAVAVPTSSLTENLKVINETIGAFGSLEHAMEHLQFMQKAASVLGAAGGEHGDTKNLAFSLAKVEEMRGRALNGAEFNAEAGDLVRAMAFFHGKFNPEEARLFGVQAKDAFKFLDSRYLTTVVPSIIAEIGGERAGTGLNAFNTVLMGRIRDKKQVAEWMKYDLIDPKEVVGGKDGPISWKAGAVKGTDLAQRDTEAWFKQVVFPALKAHGVDTNDPAQLGLVLSTMFRNQNSRYWAYLNADPQQLMQRDKDAALIGKTGSMDDMYSRNLDTGVATPWGAMVKGVEDLATAVSSPAMERAGPILSSIASGMQQMAAAAKDHPLAATAAGAAVGGGALWVSGYLAYQFLAAGTSLNSAGAELSAAAVALTRAAAVQGGKGLAEDAAPASWGSRARGVLLAGGAIGGDIYATTLAAQGTAAEVERRAAQGDFTNFNGIDAPIDPFGLAGKVPESHTTWQPSALGEGIENALSELKGWISKPLDVTGKVESELKGEAKVSVSVKVEGPGQVTGSNATSSGNVRASVGTSMENPIDAGAGIW